VTELTTAELWQSAPIETDLHRKRREAAERIWHPTTPTREALMIALQVLTNEEKK
jgi:hypothetical protein